MRHSHPLPAPTAAFRPTHTAATAPRTRLSALPRTPRPIHLRRTSASPQRLGGSVGRHSGSSLSRRWVGWIKLGWSRPRGGQWEANGLSHRCPGGGDPCTVPGIRCQPVRAANPEVQATRSGVTHPPRHSGSSLSRRWVGWIRLGWSRPRGAGGRPTGRVAGALAVETRTVPEIRCLPVGIGRPEYRTLVPASLTPPPPGSSRSRWVNWVSLGWSRPRRLVGGQRTAPQMPRRGSLVRCPRTSADP